jgi:hypothetical protein
MNKNSITKRNIDSMQTKVGGKGKKPYGYAVDYLNRVGEWQFDYFTDEYQPNLGKGLRQRPLYE